MRPSGVERPGSARQTEAHKASAMHANKLRPNGTVSRDAERRNARVKASNDPWLEVRAGCRGMFGAEDPEPPIPLLGAPS